ncbi:hypothetical protein ES708_09325 [subsurface metagenome]
MKSVDILINNAGFLQKTLFTETSNDTAERTFNIFFIFSLLSYILIEKARLRINLLILYVIKN